MRQFEQDTTRLRSLRQHPGEKRTLAASDIDNRAIGPIVGGNGRDVLLLSTAGYRRVENRARIGVLTKIRIERHAENVRERRLACLDAIIEVPNGAQMPVFAQHDGEGAQRSRCVGAQAGGERR